ncbi:hypothetical protein ACIHIX_34790 [Streptomyces sp. NPDC051913]
MERRIFLTIYGATVTTLAASWATGTAGLQAVREQGSGHWGLG